MSPNTQKIYTYAVANFSAFHGRSPDKLGLEDVRNYHLHLVSRNLKPTTINPIMGALRFFNGTTLGQKHVADQIPYARRADSLPAVLSREEVQRFLKSVPNLKMRTAFITIYAAGECRARRPHRPRHRQRAYGHHPAIFREIEMHPSNETPTAVARFQEILEGEFALGEFDFQGALRGLPERNQNIPLQIRRPASAAPYQSAR